MGELPVRARDLDSIHDIQPTKTVHKDMVQKCTIKMKAGLLRSDDDRRISAGTELLAKVEIYDIDYFVGCLFVFWLNYT